jgi:hypothetical protein
MDHSKFVEQDGCILVSVRCLGLGLSSKSSLPSAGLLSGLYVSWSKNPNVKNEKKLVRIEQSDHFQPDNVKLPLKFKTIYTSETFEDIVDIFPSLLARVPISEGYDSKLKLSVYYSSSLTSGKEIVLASQTFLESDLTKSVQHSSVYIINLESEYCIASKAYVDIIQPLPPLLENRAFPVAASHTEKNPLTQNYVFYNELDSITPYLDAKEQSYEPKFVAPIPFVFLSNVQQSLEKSIDAWHQRYEIERKRQGRFISDTEALSFGWHVLDISVKGARIGSTKATIDRINYVRNQNNSNAASSASANQSQADPNIYVSHYPLSEDFPDDPSTGGFAIPPLTRSSSTRQAGGRKTQHSGFKFLGGSSATKKIDESLPSTFIEIHVEDL